MKQKTIRLSRIKISQEMKVTMPRVETLQEKYSFYRRYRKLQSSIVLDNHNVLVDGYTSYLLAKMFGIKKGDVTIL